MPKQNVKRDVDLFDDIPSPAIEDLTNEAFDKVRTAARESGDSHIQVRSADGLIQVGGLLLTSQGIISTGTTVTEDDMMRTGALLKKFGGSINLLIGDWLVRAKLMWGDYKQVALQLGYDLGTLYNMHYTCDRVPPILRYEDLNYSHYYAVAKLPETERAQWLKDAHDHHWSYRELRDAMGLDKTSTAPTAAIINKLKSQKKQYAKMKAGIGSIGAGERRQISQIIDEQIRELQSLKRAMFGKE